MDDAERAANLLHPMNTPHVSPHSHSRTGNPPDYVGSDIRDNPERESGRCNFQGPKDKTEEWDMKPSGLAKTPPARESAVERAMRVAPHAPPLGKSCSMRESEADLKRLLPTDSATRKKYPMAAGLMDYFPDALAAVSHVSYLGNEKHNPGEALHHARGKSMDHADCIMRHLLNRGGFDGDVRESAAMAWRALALLQEELEKEMGLPLPRGAR